MNNSLLKEKWVKTEIKKEIKDFLELNENTYASQSNLWNTMKPVLTDKFIAQVAT